MHKNIFLLSDQAVHWNIVPGESRKHIFMDQWGNHSIQKLMAYCDSYFNPKGSSAAWSLLDNGMGIEESQGLNPASSSCNHVFTTWKQYPEGKTKIWRIDEIEHAGQSDQDVSVNSGNLSQADLVIIQDWGLKIADLTLPSTNQALADKWIIYRMHPPLFQGSLWKSIQNHLGQRGVLLVRANDLRSLDISISKGLSWEQTLQDFITEIYCKSNISLHPLRKAAYVIITFGHTGTLLIHNQNGPSGSKPEIQFFFDPLGTEDYWETVHPGYLPGSLELLAVLLAREVLFTAEAGKIDLVPAIRAHLLASRAQHLAGGAPPESSLDLSGLSEALDKGYGPEPSQELSPVILELDLFQCLYETKQKNLPGPTRNWSLLSRTRWDFYSLARKIALFGPMKALQGWSIPIAKYNFLITVDRKEIEFLHHLKTLISEYLLGKNDQPLSIAVFGPPGSGKSFSIKQLAKSLGLPNQEIKDITFNLSQFNEDNPTDLYQAFHAVRDIALSGKTPLVFWDEFDSKSLTWLRYFLAPMQDGEFQEGQLTHYIGKAIFVFAGGTCASMEEFEVKSKLAVAEKGPDFLSRIKGFINVMGPNPILPYPDSKNDTRNREDAAARFILAMNSDPEYIIRRAILVNSLLSLKYKDLFEKGRLQIDDGVLNALLMVPSYKHGTRSMETIFRISQLFGKRKFHRSDLPPVSQLDMHVDGDLFYDLVSEGARYFQGGEAFYYLVNEIDLEEKLIEKMGVGIHAVYSLVAGSAKEVDPLTITKEQFMDQYQQMQVLPASMPPDEVSQNYHSARKIPEKLAAVGYKIVPIDSEDSAEQLSNEAFEKVSRLEHIRWVRHHIDAGWQFSPVKNKALKQHDALVAWDEHEREQAELIYGQAYIQKMGLEKGQTLSEPYRNLDRATTMAIPWILEIAMYKIIKA